MAGPLRLGTRGSKLALWQAEHVAAALRARHGAPAVELQVITTQGDRAADVPLQQISGQGVFARAIEDALLAGEIDLAVHSLKDLPGQDRQGLVLAAFPPRADARDALVGAAFAALPAGARVATSSPRRAAQLLAARADLRIVGIRGNVDTRLRKLAAEGLDAVVLAVAGLERLGLGYRIAEALPIALCLPGGGSGRPGRAVPRRRRAHARRRGGTRRSGDAGRRRSRARTAGGARRGLQDPDRRPRRARRRPPAARGAGGRAGW